MPVKRRPTPRRPAAPIEKHRSLRSAAYKELRERILTGGFVPGRPINLVDVPKELGVGYAAVREALCQLTSDGLVIAEDQRGFLAAPMSSQDLVDLTEARTAVEAYALRSAIARADLAWEERLTRSYQRLVDMRKDEAEDPRVIGRAYREQHREFHEALVSTCSSQWMLRFRRTLHDNSERYWQLAVVANSEKRDANAEHFAIMEAALARNADRAVDLLTAHVEETCRMLLRLGVLTT